MMVKTKQVAPGRAETNPNDLNSKFQTNDPPKVVPNGIMTGKPRYKNRIRHNFGESFGH